MSAQNKFNTLPTHKQPSVDSLITDPSASTSTSDPWASHTSDASSHPDTSSPEQHSGAPSAKRHSVFSSLRSRSNTSTSTSTASSLVPVSPRSMAAHDTASHRLSQDIRHLSGQSFMESNGTKRSLFRGKKGKRLSGSHSPSFHTTEFDEAEITGKRSSILRKSRKPSFHSDASMQTLKNRISSPFDFQHLTHTDRHQFTAAIHQASKAELAAEYWAVRSAQAPRRDLTGIKAEDLHFSNFSSDNVASARSPSMPVLKSPASEPSLDQHQDKELPEKPSDKPLPRPPLRSTRSADNFSMPGINPRIHRHTQSANPPPRVSSRKHVASIGHLTEESMEQEEPATVTAQSHRHSGVWNHLAPLSPMAPKSPCGTLPTMAEESDCVGHALTTPDNSAIPITPPFSPALADVAEEPERFVSPRPAPQPPVRLPKTPLSPAFESYSFSHPRSPASSIHSCKPAYTSPKSTQRSPMTRPMSQASETLGSPVLTRKTSTRRSPSVRRKSNTWRVIEESWEDDIDYIYDNALEADCDFEWDRSSFDEVRAQTPEPQDQNRQSVAASFGTTVSSYSIDGSPKNIFQGVDRPSLVVPSPGSVPELESRSAVSTSTIEPSLHTPSDSFGPLAPSLFPATEAEAFSLTPSLLIPQDFKDEMSREDIYDDLLADYEDSDRHFPLLDSTRSIASSTRSSHIRSSKRSSYDSSMMSSGHGSTSGSVSWASGMRRSASSSGSLPELVHSSRHARRDFNAVVDCLSQQVASFASFTEDEDNETTPPGDGTQRRTFFAEEEAYVEPEDCRRASVESDMKTSLELARQGSTRSSRAPLFHHKYASSDGATKILMSASQEEPEHKTCTLSRHRAASSATQTKPREQYLSLFPAPPRHAPLSPPTTPLSPATTL